MSNFVREILDFARLEPEAIGDLREMVKACGFEELQLIERIAGNLFLAVRQVKTERNMFTGEMNPNREEC